VPIGQRCSYAATSSSVQNRDAGVLWSNWISYASGGICFDELRICSPPEEPAHRFKEVPRLGWRRMSPISASCDCGARDLCVRLVAC
jgi:hypothetical protein